MPKLAIALWCVFLAVSLGARIAIQLRTTGSSGVVSCYVAGVSSAFLSQLTLGRSWRVGVDASERTELVTRGAYSVVRNPIFSALFLTSTGLALLCSTPLAWLALAVQLLALELQVRGVEEPYLARTHGGAYLDYGGRVGRFVPGMGLLSNPTTP